MRYPKALEVFNHVMQRKSYCFSRQVYSAPSDKDLGQIGSESQISSKITKIVSRNFLIHPFSKFLTQENVRGVLASYLAMSQAFPLVQAGSQANLILNCIRNNTDIPKNVEETFVVGAFLSFDETGGNFLIRENGIKILPEILNSDKHFHSSLLKKDIQRLMQSEIPPDYTGPTRTYLLNLLEDLGSSDPIKRCATMVAFELHAGQMIESLWSAIHKLYPEIDKDSLEYFRVHVGGDDPQEEYHKMLTQCMINRIVPPEEETRFIEEVYSQYNTHARWCSDICHHKA